MVACTTTLCSVILSEARPGSPAIPLLDRRGGRQELAAGAGVEDPESVEQFIAAPSFLSKIDSESANFLLRFVRARTD